MKDHGFQNAHVPIVKKISSTIIFRKEAIIVQRSHYSSNSFVIIQVTANQSSELKNNQCCYMCTLLDSFDTFIQSITHTSRNASLEMPQLVTQQVLHKCHKTGITKSLHEMQRSRKLIIVLNNMYLMALMILLRLKDLNKILLRHTHLTVQV